MTCPECGAVHRRARSMRRTRRRWGCAAVALLLIVASYHGFERRRAVASRGWMAGVPLPLLVLPTAWMSEKPGSVWAGDPNAASGFEFAMAAELAARGPRYGRVARWMLVEIGKRSSAEVITDRTTIKGAVFRTVFARLYGERVLSPSQGRWARSVVWAGFDTRNAWNPDAAVHGVLRTRSLVGGPYEVEVLNAPGRFESFWSGESQLPSAVGAPKWLGGSGRGAGPMADPLRAQMLEAWSWDGITPVRDASWNGARDGVVAMVVDEFMAWERGDLGGYWFTVLFRSLDPDDVYTIAGRSIGQAAVPVALVREVGAGPQILSDSRTRAWLTGSLRARLVPVSQGPWGGDWRAAVKLTCENAPQGGAITLGGRTSVMLRRAGGQGQALLAGEGCWFRVDPGVPGRVTARVRGSGLKGWSGALVEDLSGGMPAAQAGDRLVVRLEPEHFEAHRSVFGDLEAARVFLGVIEVPLEGWTLEEINRLRVSGVWPDHAMGE